MYKTEIKNNEVILEGVPYSKWTVEHQLNWKANTAELLGQCERIHKKIRIVYQRWGMK